MSGVPVRNRWPSIAATSIALLAVCCFAVSCAGPPKPQAGASTPAASRAAPSAAGATLAAIKQRGRLLCGANVGLAGFGADFGNGQWRGLDVDFCRAVASAVFGDATKVEFVPLTTEQRFVALQRGDIDVLARNSVYTLSRDTSLGLDFAAVTFYDGQGFLIARDSGFRHVQDLRNATVCVQGGTTTQYNIGEYSKRAGLGMQAVVFATGDAATNAFAQGRCDALTSDATYLAAARAMLPNPASYRILPERISKEPLAPVVREGDNAWADIIRWTHFAMLTAEEQGITSANVDRMRQSSQDYQVRFLLGTSGDFGKGLGLSNDWAYNIIKQVGNYAEVFERNVGMATPLRMARDQNALWKDGGLQYAPPIR